MPKLPKGVRTIGEAAKARGRGGQILKSSRTRIHETMSPVTRRGERAKSVAPKAFDVGERGSIARQAKQSTRAKIELARKPKGTVGKPKLPKGVQSISEASTARGRGGVALKEIRMKLGRQTPRTQRGVRAQRVTGEASPSPKSFDLTKLGKQARRIQSGQTARASVDLKKAPKPSKMGRLGKIARGVGRLGAIGMALGAYSMAKDFQAARKPKRQQM